MDFRTPAIQRADQQLNQIREDVHFIKGRIIVRSQMTVRGRSQALPGPGSGDGFTAGTLHHALGSHEKG